MSDLSPIWQSLLLVPVLAIGLYVSLWIASRFSENPED
jgi:hypothetical protein